MNSTDARQFFCISDIARSVIAIVACSCLFHATAKLGRAAVGDVLATFPFQSVDLVVDPDQPYVYASVPATNSVEVINTHTLAVVRSIQLSGSPNPLTGWIDQYGMAITPDGKTLYVADSANHSIEEINTQTLTLSRSIPLTTVPMDVAVGLNNRLFVLDSAPILYGGYQKLQQFDATTGAKAGPDVPNVSYFGNIQISPDQKTLYYGDHGLSAGSLAAFDVSTSTPTLLRDTSPGENGEKVVLSHSGTLIVQPSGGPYAVTEFQSSNFAALGSFNTGAYPNALAFSPDDMTAYASHSTYPTAVDIYSTTNFGLQGQFSIPDESQEMVTDRTGHELFVALTGAFYGDHNTVIYDTGVPVPEPSTAILFVVGLASFAVAGIRKARRRPLNILPATGPSSPTYPAR